MQAFKNKVLTFSPTAFNMNIYLKKVVRKRSTQPPFTERTVHRLKDRLKQELWKVAFEPEG